MSILFVNFSTKSKSISRNTGFVTVVHGKLQARTNKNGCTLFFVKSKKIIGLIEISYSILVRDPESRLTV